jgi:hypothetical protein
MAEKLATNMNTEALNIKKSEGWIVTIQCLQGLKNLVITELTIATLFAQVFVMRHQMTSCWFLSFSSGLTCGLLKNHRTSSFWRRHNHFLFYDGLTLTLYDGHLD